MGSYLKVLENLDRLTKGDKITEKDILNIHLMLTADTLENSSDCGTYRNRYVVVGNRLTGGIIFRPPENEEVPGLVRELVEWVNSDEAKELDPILVAGIAHYEFVSRESDILRSGLR